MAFNDRNYTMEAIIKQVGLMELHGKDGSAVEASCGCIEGKHTFLLEALAEEAIGFSESKQEQAFYNYVADVARTIRRHVEDQNWSIPGSAHECPPCPECHACPPCKS